MKRLATVIIIMLMLSPLGIIIPELCGAQGAWGEWDIGSLQHIAGFVPEGIKRLSDIWHPAVPGYDVPAWTHAGVTTRSLGYVLSGIAGACLAGCSVFVLFFRRTKK